MALPKYDEMYMPLLESVKDGNVYTAKEVKDSIAKKLRISTEDRAERLPSGNGTIYNNRFGWAVTYLRKAGLITSPGRAQLRISDEGKRLLISGEKVTNKLMEERYPEFSDFVHGKGKSKKVVGQIVGDDRKTSETPQETLDRTYSAINDQLADDLLAEIMIQSPVFFENLVVDLMKAMGYGDGFVTKASRDDGIDGIINEDKLGFSLIYIQAKRWRQDTSIGKPEIQKFVGAMMGPPKIDKGLFITTAKFSESASKYADAQHIILIDGKKLTELMIEHDVGVSVQKTYRIKRIDSDYFAEI